MEGIETIIRKDTVHETYYTCIGEIKGGWGGNHNRRILEIGET